MKEDRGGKWVRGLGYHSRITGCVGGILAPKLIKDTSKQFLDHHQKNSIFVLAYLDDLLLCIFSHFHVYMIENIPFEKGELTIFYIDILNFFSFFFADRSSVTQLCGKSGAHIPTI